MSWDLVRAWRDRLRAQGPGSSCGLSSAGANWAWTTAWDAVSDDVLDEISAMKGTPYGSCCFIAASTVPAAPIEWCAVLLGRGTEVRLRRSSRGPGWAAQLADVAQDLGLPLTLAEDLDAELVVAMGSDQTLAQLEHQVSGRFLGFGHRVSFAVTDTAFEAVAQDHALYDSRGCMSPHALLTTRPLDEACALAAEALQRAQQRWPTGELAPGERAAIRERRALARVMGVVHEGDGWSVHGLPAEPFAALPLPRSLAVVQTADPQAFLDHHGPLSTVGTDRELRAEGARLCRPGQMQRPPIHRLHDGVDWLAQTFAGPRAPERAPVENS